MPKILTSPAKNAREVVNPLKAKQSSVGLSKRHIASMDLFFVIKFSQLFPDLNFDMCT